MRLENARKRERRRINEMLTKKEGTPTGPSCYKLQYDNVPDVLSISKYAYLETRMCKLCMCVQRGEMPSKGQARFKNCEMGHFPRSRILAKLKDRVRTTYLWTRICRFFAKYIHIQRHKWTRIDNNVHGLRHKYVGFRLGGRAL